MSLLDYTGLGIRHLRVNDLANGVGLLAILYLKLSMMLTLLVAFGFAYWNATSAYLEHQGFNCLTITTTEDKGLDPEHLSRLELSFPNSQGFRVIPEITTLIHVTAASGEPKAIVTSSFVADDPAFREMPILAHQGISQDAASKATEGLVLSPDVLRRLGYQLTNLPSILELHISPAGQPAERHSWQMPWSAVSGHLGKVGLRLPYQTMKEVRNFQHYGSSQRSNPAGPLEIDAIHLWLPSEVAVDSVLAKLQAIDPHYQLSSPWFERGKQRNLMSTTMTMVSPALTLLISANIIVLLVLAWQKAQSDRKQLCLLKLSGASFAQLMAWYVVPQIMLYGFTTGCGVLIASSIYDGQVLPVLEQAVGSSISGEVPIMVLITSIVGTAFLFHALTVHRQIQPWNMENSLSS
ncbi:MAG: hypothetical protein JNL67_16900 [Planctomycetaceae bacterium]|nr:hypothetical protein [Planctomycetaceae bacterium]